MDDPLACHLLQGVGEILAMVLLYEIRHVTRFDKMELAAKHGVLRMNELRQFAGLPEDPAFQGQLVGGKNLLTHSRIEAGVAEFVRGELGGVGADGILELVDRQDSRSVPR